MEENFRYSQLGDKQFERLSYLLLLQEPGALNPQFFGRRGQAQYGIDLISRSPDGIYSVYQCKNHATSFTKAQLQAWLDLFLTDWMQEQNLPCPRYFYLLTSLRIAQDTSLHETFLRVSQAFEKSFQEKTGKRIVVGLKDQSWFDERLKQLPAMVAIFWGENTAQLLCHGYTQDPRIFLHFKGKESTSPYFKDFLAKRERIYISPAIKASFFKKLDNEKHSLLVRGLPAAGKTFLCLELADRYFQEQFNLPFAAHVYYINFKSRPGIEALWSGVQMRGRVPAVFIFDDCQVDLEVVASLAERLNNTISIFCPNVYFLFLMRSGLREKTDGRVENDDFHELFKDIYFDIHVDEAFFKELLAATRPQEANDAAGLFHLSGGDLLILDELLTEKDAGRDIKGIQNGKGAFYESIIRRYLKSDQSEFAGVIEIAALAQFDMGIRDGYFKQARQKHQDELPIRNALKDLSFGGDQPLKWYFLHTSMAELLCRAVIAKAGKESFVQAVAGAVVKYFLTVDWGLETSNDIISDDFNLALNAFCYNHLKLNVDEEKAIKRHVFKDEGLKTFIHENFDFIYPNLFTKIFLILEGDSFFEEGYMPLIRLKIEDGSFAEKMIFSNRRECGHFHHWLKERYSQLFGEVLRQLSKFGDSHGWQNWDFISFVSLLKNLRSKDFIEQVTLVIKSISTANIDRMIDNTIDQKRSIRTIHLGFRELKKNGLLQLLEKTICPGNLIKLIQANGTFVDLTKFLENTTPGMAQEIINALSRETIAAIIDKTIKEQRSIGTINLGFRELAENGLLQPLEETIGPVNLIKLIQANGTFVELIRFLQHSTPGMAQEIINALSRETMAVIIDKTIEKKHPLKSIKWDLYNLQRFCGGFNEIFETKIGMTNILRLVIHNCSISAFPAVMEILPPPLRQVWLNTFNNLETPRKQSILARSNFFDLCFTLVHAPAMNILDGYSATELTTVIDDLVNRADCESLQAGVALLKKAENCAWKDTLIHRVNSWLSGRDYRSIRFTSETDKVYYLSLLSFYDKLDTALMQAVLTELLSNHKKLVKEIKDLKVFNSIWGLLAQHARDKRLKEEWLCFSNSDLLLPYFKKEKLLHLFLILWNLYTLWDTVPQGKFAKWLNPKITEVLTNRINKYKDARKNTDDYGPLLILLGLADWLGIAPQRIKQLFPRDFRVDLSRRFLEDKLNKSSFLTGFFFLKGNEFFMGDRQVQPEIYRLLEPKLEEYQKISTKALQKVVDEYKSRVAGG